jgi:hypothetical protein
LQLGVEMMRRAWPLVALVAVFAMQAGFYWRELHGPRPFVWIDPRLGAWTLNTCGTYDRWILWRDARVGTVDRLRLPWFPNGVFGRRASDCEGE